MVPHEKYIQRPGNIIVAAVVLPLMGILAVMLRFWIRKRQKQPLKADDWLMIPAIILVCGTSISVIYGVSREVVAYPIHLHSGERRSMLCQIQWIFGMMFPLTLGIIKASFSFFYIRIFSVHRKSPVNFLLVGMIILHATISTTFFMADLLQCAIHFETMWNSNADFLVECTYEMKMVLAICIVDFITGVISIGIPIPLVWRLNLSTSKKIVASMVFLLGTVVIVASFIRLVMMATLIVRIVQKKFHPADKGLFLTEYLYWGVVEGGVGICAACLPTLQYLFRNWSWKSVVNNTRSHFKSKYSDTQYQGIKTNPLKHPDPVYSTRVKRYGDSNITIELRTILEMS